LGKAKDNIARAFYFLKRSIEQVTHIFTHTQNRMSEVENFEKVKVSLAGRSSSFVSKLSYTLRFKKKSNSRLHGFKNFKLRALDIDSSYVREHTAFSCIKSAGVPSTGFSYIRLKNDMKKKKRKRH
jgi:hypothetical protein